MSVFRFISAAVKDPFRIYNVIIIILSTELYVHVRYIIIIYYPPCTLTRARMRLNIEVSLIIYFRILPSRTSALVVVVDSIISVVAIATVVVVVDIVGK